MNIFNRYGIDLPAFRYSYFLIPNIFIMSYYFFDDLKEGFNMICISLFSKLFIKKIPVLVDGELTTNYFIPIYINNRFITFPIIKKYNTEILWDSRNLTSSERQLVNNLLNYKMCWQSEKKIKLMDNLSLSNNEYHDREVQVSDI
jgi:hypothetical protein